MGQTIVKEIKLNYVATGVTDIKKALDQLDISKLDKKSKASFKKLQSMAKSFQKSFDRPESEGPMSKDEISNMQGLYKKFLNETQKLWNNMFESVDSEFSQAVQIVNDEIEKTSQKLLEVKKQQKGIGKRVKVEGGVAVAANANQDDILNKKIIADLKQQGVIKGKLLSYSGREIVDAKILVELKEKLLADVEKIPAKYREATAEFIKGGAATKDSIEGMKQLELLSDSKLNSEQMTTGVLQNNAIQKEKEKRLAADLLEIKTLETKKMGLEKTLQSDLIAQKEVEKI